MTVTAFVQKLLPHLKHRDLGTMPIDSLADIASAVNGGLQEFFALAPAIYKRTTLFHLIKAPEKVTLKVSHGSFEVDEGEPFKAEHRGQSIRIGNDPAWNEIVSPTGFLDAYRGTGGTVEATIYSDVFSLGDDMIEDIVDDPRIDGRVLERDDDIGDWRLFRGGMRRTGRPNRYSVEMVGLSRSDPGSPLCLVRLDPVPIEEHSIRMKIQIAPRTFYPNELTGVAQLPVPDRWIETHLLPLAAERLTTSPLWANSRTIPSINNQARAARYLISGLPPQIGPMGSRIFTPAGY